MDDWKFELESNQSHSGQYWLPIGHMMGDIYMGLAKMLTGRYKVRRCEYDGGKRHKECKNVFTASMSSTRYCPFSKCYDKARRARTYEKHGK